VEQRRERALTPATGCKYTEMFYAIRGAEDFYAGKLKRFADVGVEVADPHTLRVTLHSRTTGSRSSRTRTGGTAASCDSRRWSSARSPT
jgi:ABC-type oligopeptide transport system substrate-binding subunit